MVLKPWVWTPGRGLSFTGVAYQVSYISDVVVMVHTDSKITVLK